jgi:hypothetical protein
MPGHGRRRCERTRSGSLHSCVARRSQKRIVVGYVPVGLSDCAVEHRPPKLVCHSATSSPALCLPIAPDEWAHFGTLDHRVRVAFLRTRRGRGPLPSAGVRPPVGTAEHACAWRWRPCPSCPIASVVRPRRQPPDLPGALKPSRWNLEVAARGCPVPQVTHSIPARPDAQHRLGADQRVAGGNGRDIRAQPHRRPAHPHMGDHHGNRRASALRPACSCGIWRICCVRFRWLPTRLVKSIAGCSGP